MVVFLAFAVNLIGGERFATLSQVTCQFKFADVVQNVYVDGIAMRIAGSMNSSTTIHTLRFYSNSTVLD